MGKISDNPGADRQKVIVTEHNLLVTHGQSKKLAELRKKLQPNLPVGAVPKKPLPSGLKPEVSSELDKARTLIDASITQIMRSFPKGMKNRLFGFKFGSVDAIKTMSIKSAFKILGIDECSVAMKLIAKLDFHGNEVKGS